MSMTSLYLMYIRTRQYTKSVNIKRYWDEGRTVTVRRDTLCSYSFECFAISSAFNFKLWYVSQLLYKSIQSILTAIFNWWCIKEDACQLATAGRRWSCSSCALLMLGEDVTRSSLDADKLKPVPEASELHQQQLAACDCSHCNCK